MTFISMATARVATAWPMRPRPTMPSVLPANCVPMNFLRSQRPSTRLWWAGAMFRTRPYIRASVCSAVEIVLPAGRVHHHDALPGGGLRVDVVDAHASPGDRLEPVVALRATRR